MKTFKIDFSTLYYILAIAKWSIKDINTKDKEDEETLEICKNLQMFLLNHEEDFFEIKGSNPF